MTNLSNSTFLKVKRHLTWVLQPQAAIINQYKKVTQPLISGIILSLRKAVVKTIFFITNFLGRGREYISVQK